MAEEQEAASAEEHSGGSRASGSARLAPSAPDKHLLTSHPLQPHPSCKKGKQESLSQRSAFSLGQWNPKMSQGVTYADLQFARVPLENTPRPRKEGPGDGDLTYENIHGAEPKGAEASGGSEQQKGPKTPLWPMAWGLLGVSLCLLAAAVAFGVLYKQVSRHLQEAEAELNWSRTALREREARLDAILAKACAGWCPEEWLLHGGKCLFFSAQGQTWTESQRACQRMDAWLLGTRSEVPAALPRPLASSVYWTGQYETWSQEDNKRVRVWSDGSHQKGPDSRHDACMALRDGKWASSSCSKKNRYVCEKPARPGGWPA